MSSATFIKCLTGISLAGAASIAPPAFYSVLKTSSLQSEIKDKIPEKIDLKSQTQSRSTGISQERLEIDRKHDECVDNNVKLTIKNASGETKKVTLLEFTKQYKGWTITGEVEYTPQCSRELPEN